MLTDTLDRVNGKVAQTATVTGILTLRFQYKTEAAGSSDQSPHARRAVTR